MEQNIHYVNKQTLQVVIYTRANRIEGTVHVLYSHRALDMLNLKDQFIAVTDASIYPLEGVEVLYKGNFIAINKNEIVFLYEE